MNKYEQVPDEIIDLHYYTVREAETVLNSLTQKRGKSHVRVIVGRGVHSKNGPVLREFVKKYLLAKNIRFNQSKISDGGEGSLEVFL